jgi:PRC-barrel domain
MLKQHMAACLVASAFITMPVLAQTSTSPGASQPATGAASGSSGQGAAASGGAGRFITQQQQNQWRASRLIGINVYGADNERIGDINEVLVDRQGNADAVVVGVGGFLGIGEKNVALPFNAFEWQMDDTRRTAAAGGTGGASGTGGAGSARTGTGTAAGTGDMAGAGAGAGSGTGAGPAAGTGGTAGTTAGTSGTTAGTSGTTAGTSGTGAGTLGTAGTGTTASTSAAGGGASGSAARSGAERGYPDHAVLRMTKADLEGAPTFRYVGDRSDTGGSGGGAARSPATSGGAGGGATSPGTTK